nr:MAG TPA: hypothetical protein [Bacteriophage sp.]
MYYSIKITPTRYVLSYGDGLLETTTANHKVFTRDECDEALDVLKGRYIYEATLEDDEGNVEVVNTLPKKEAESRDNAPEYESDECFEL